VSLAIQAGFFIGRLPHGKMKLPCAVATIAFPANLVVALALWRLRVIAPQTTRGFWFWVFHFL
jgi:hypothetical protein